MKIEDGPVDDHTCDTKSKAYGYSCWLAYGHAGPHEYPIPESNKEDDMNMRKLLRSDQRSPANVSLANKWDNLPIQLPYGPSEFIDLIDGTNFIMLAGVPDGKDLPLLAVIVDAIRKMHGLDYAGAREALRKVDVILELRINNS